MEEFFRAISRRFENLSVEQVVTTTDTQEQVTGANERFDTYGFDLLSPRLIPEHTQ